MKYMFYEIGKRNRRERVPNSFAAGQITDKMIINIIVVLVSSSTILFSPCTYAESVNEADSVAALNSAQVVIDGAPLFTVRGVSSYPAQKRSKIIEANIEKVANDLSLSPESINVRPGQICDTIRIKSDVIMNVYDPDAELEGVSREIYSHIIKNKIIDIIYSYRYERKSEALLSKTFYALSATVIVILLLLLLSWGTKKLSHTLEKKLKRKIDSLGSRSFQLIKSNQLWITVLGIVRISKFIVSAIILFFYIQYVLGLYPWSRFISVSLFEFFLSPIRTIGIATLNFIPSLIFLIVLFFITKYLLKLIKIFFNGIVNGTITFSGFEAELALPTYKIIRMLFIVFAIVVAYPFIPGSETTAFKGISIFIGLLFSLGSTSIIGNITAGYSMVYRRTFKSGDIVKIDKHVGQVTDIKLLITKLLTFKNEEIIVPNSLILNSNIINYSSALKNKNGIILYTSVGIGYETPWRQVEGMLMLAAERTEGIMKDPKPFVRQKSLGDFAVNYELNVYCNDPINMLNHYTAMHRNILDVFNENNVQIMTPAYECDPETPKVVPKEQWSAPVIGMSK